MRSRKQRKLSSHVEASEMEETRVFDKDHVSGKSKRSWITALAVVFLAALLFGGGALVGMYRFASEPSSELIPPEAMEDFAGRINILVMGIDTGVNGGGAPVSPDGKRSDVLMLVSIDPEMREASILSIPRDTRTFIPGKIQRYEKIGHAHAYGGPDLAVETVKALLDVPVHHYVRVDFTAFKKAVDVLGGVDFDVPQDMYYKDEFQDLVIDLKKGPQSFDGEKALEFVRFRSYVNGDIGRIQAQEAFLKEVVKKAFSISGALKLPDLISECLPYFKTSLIPQDILYLGETVRKMKPENITMGIVPGTDQWITEGDTTLSYWIPNVQAMSSVVERMIRGVSKDKNGQVRVAIQNGCGITGAADMLATILRDQGFQVVSVGNAPTQDYAATRILSTGDKRDSQALVARALRLLCPEAKAYKSNDVTEGADVLVIIGKDYKAPSRTGGY